MFDESETSFILYYTRALIVLYVCTLVRTIPPEAPSGLLTLHSATRISFRDRDDRRRATHKPADSRLLFTIISRLYVSLLIVVYRICIVGT